MVDFLELFHDRKFDSTLEREYCVKQLEEREKQLTFILWLGNIIYCAIYPLYALFLGGSQPAVAGVSAIIAATQILTLLYSRKKSHYFRKKLLLALAFAAALYLPYLLSFYNFSQYPTEFKFLYIWTLISFGNMFLILPFRNWVHWALNVFLSVTFILCMNHTQAPTFYTGLYFFVINVTSSLQIIAYRTSRGRLITEFRIMARYIPNQVIKHSIVTNISLANIYQSKELFCTCISSDWRNFQEMTAVKTPTEVGEILSAYYDNINKMLRTFFPDGNYFYDWIADELFLVIFSNETISDQDLVRKSLDFSRCLALNRLEFENKFGLPNGLDIGIAAGKAVIGVFGPQGQAKATAFGEVAGQSRRLQTIGKMIRSERTNEDRVVFNSRVKDYLDADDIRYKEIEIQHKVKDLQTKKFFFLEPHSDKKSPSKKIA